MTVALLTIGTELTRGELENSNSTWLAAELSERGYEVTTMLTVDDDAARIERSLELLARDHRAIFATGGLGPTTDDMTSACIARALGVRLVRDEPSLEHIRLLFASVGRELTPSNEKQADFPEGAVILPNYRGTAAGFRIEWRGCQAYFMPGVPAEMRTMFLQQALPSLNPPERSVVTARVQTYGLAEAEVNERLSGIEAQFGVILGYRASSSQIEVKVLAESSATETRERAMARAERVIDVVCERLGPVAYGRGKTNLPTEVGKALAQRQLTLALAESCTGGLLSEWITQVPGASRYYQGGVVSYENGVKERVLGVPATVLRDHGAVSEPTARAMAQGARSVLAADVAISVTGIAGPSGGTEDKPVGLVHWAVASASETISFHRVFRGSRDTIRKRSAVAALASLLTFLNESKEL